MRNSLILLLSFLMQAFVFPQENRRYYNDEELKKVSRVTGVADRDTLFYPYQMDIFDFYRNPAWDTLFIGKKCFFFILEGSPLSFFEKSVKLVYPFGGIIWNREADLRYYAVVWQIKKGKLYVDRLNPERVTRPFEQIEGENTEDYEIWEKKQIANVEHIIVQKSEKQAKKDLEKFVGRKFNRKGLLEADWATGKFFVLNFQPQKFRGAMGKELREKLEIYSIELKQGKLVKIRRQRGIENMVK
jgi:hypothetical protein